MNRCVTYSEYKEVSGFLKKYFIYPCIGNFYFSLPGAGCNNLERLLKYSQGFY